MKRVLKFEADKASESMFEILYLALMAAEVPARPLPTLRLELATLHDLDDISESLFDEKGDTLVHPAGFALRKLRAPAELTLEQPQADLLLQRLERVAWRTQGAQAVIDVADRLSQ